VRSESALDFRAGATAGRELVRSTRWQSKSVVYNGDEKHSFLRDFPAGSRAAPVSLPGGERKSL